jgi:hypothetical protein
MLLLYNIENKQTQQDEVVIENSTKPNQGGVPFLRSLRDKSDPAIHRRTPILSIPNA